MPILPISSLPSIIHCDSVSLYPDQTLKTKASPTSLIRCPLTLFQTSHCKEPKATSTLVSLVVVLIRSRYSRIYPLPRCIYNQNLLTLLSSSVDGSYVSSYL